ncbi:MAG: histidine phosphatase family protein [Acidimicrobiales bacterium]
MLWLIRHGQTMANAAGLIQGRTDPVLSDLGRRQAAALAARLPTQARVISSPLGRARHTAEIAGRTVEVDDRWIELDYGRFEGEAVRDVRADLWAHWRDDPAWAPPGGESLAAVNQRVWAACEELAGEIADGEVAVVTHVGPIKAGVAWALGAGPETAWRMHVDPASITLIGIGAQGAPVLLSFNDTGHLTGAAAGRTPSALLEPGTGGIGGSAG